MTTEMAVKIELLAGHLIGLLKGAAVKQWIPARSHITSMRDGLEDVDQLIKNEEQFERIFAQNPTERAKLLGEPLADDPIDEKPF